MCLIENIFQGISSHVLPTACIVCGVFQRRSIGVDCATLLDSERLSNYECCQQCGLTLLANEIPEQRCQECASNPTQFNETFCLDRYDGRLQSALHQLKY